MQHDAFKELVNIVCGNLLPVLAGAEAVFEVGTPCLHEGQRPREVFGQDPPSAQATLEIEGGRVELAVYVHQNATHSTA
jgi:CheY-specific phosphatase CheX